MVKYRVGIDPGKTNLGISFYDPVAKTSKLCHVDLTRFNGKKWARNEEDYDELIHAVCDKYKELFKKSDYVGVERLPKTVKSTEGKMVETNKEVKVIMYKLVTIIGMTFSNLKVFYISPVAVRSFMKTSARTYPARKRKSVELSLIPDAELYELNEKFKKQKKPITDIVEATHIAIYLSCNIKKILAVKKKTNLGVETLEMTVSLMLF